MVCVWKPALGIPASPLTPGLVLPRAGVLRPWHSPRERQDTPTHSIATAMINSEPVGWGQNTSVGYNLCQQDEAEFIATSRWITSSSRLQVHAVWQERGPAWEYTRGMRQSPSALRYRVESLRVSVRRKKALLVPPRSASPATPTWKRTAPPSGADRSWSSTPGTEYLSHLETVHLWKVRASKNNVPKYDYLRSR